MTSHIPRNSRVSPGKRLRGRQPKNAPILTPEQRVEIVALWRAGAKYKELASQFECSIGTIQRTINPPDVSRRRVMNAKLNDTPRVGQKEE